MNRTWYGIDLVHLSTSHHNVHPTINHHFSPEPNPGLEIFQKSQSLKLIQRQKDRPTIFQGHLKLKPEKPIKPNQKSPIRVSFNPKMGFSFAYWKQDEKTKSEA